MDELESLRLTDAEEKDQQTVSEMMNISQPTLSRLLKSARKKVSTALIEGKAIRIDGGDFKLVSETQFRREAGMFGKGRGRSIGGRGLENRGNGLGLGRRSRNNY